MASWAQKAGLGQGQGLQAHARDRAVRGLWRTPRLRAGASRLQRMERGPCWVNAASRLPSGSFLLLSLPRSSKRLVTLARGLSPAFLRFGGKRTDFLQFQNLRNPAKSRGGPGPDYYLKNYEDGEKLASPSFGVGKFGKWERAVCVGRVGGGRFGGEPGRSVPEKLVAAGKGTPECGTPDVITQKALSGSPGPSCWLSAGLLNPKAM